MGFKRSVLSTRRKASPPIAPRGVEGEGSYEGTRRYNAATRRFVESGRVDEAARRAAPCDADEAKSIERAERAGAARAKGEDPALNKGRLRTRTKRST